MSDSIMLDCMCVLVSHHIHVGQIHSFVAKIYTCMFRLYYVHYTICASDAKVLLSCKRGPLHAFVPC